MEDTRIKWTTQDDLEAALQLPVGRWYANVFGMNVEQSVETRYLNEAINGLQNASIDIEAFSQAEIIVMAENKNVAFQSWAGAAFGLM